jgi:uncharacterized protein (TIGR03086 family)
MTTNQSTTSAEQTRLHLRPVLADLADVAQMVTERQRSLPTPCTEYDVAALTGHVVGWLENFAAGFASADGTCPSSDVSGVDVATNAAADRVRAASRTLDVAVRNGAADRPLTIAAQGGMPGEMALSMILGEYLVHGWDLARATGQSWSPAPEAADAARQFLAGMVTPEYRGPDGMFAHEVAVPEAAPALDRLVGFAGRDPGWTA